MQPSDQQQRDKALDLSRSVLCVAPAGSGKTSLLTRRFLRCLQNAARPERVLAVTFTNKAAAEMKERISGALYAAATTYPPQDQDEFDTDALTAEARRVLERDRKRQWGLLRNQHRLRVVTFDALQMALAGDLPLSSGVSSQVGIVENPQLLYEEAVMRMLGDVDDPDVPRTVRQALAALLETAENRTDRLVGPLVALLERREQWGQALAGGDDADAVVADYVGACITRAHAWLEQLVPEIDCALAELADTDEFRARWTLEGLAAPQAGQVAAWRELAQLLTTQRGDLRARVDRRVGVAPRAGETLKACLERLREHPQAGEIAAALARVRDLPDPHYPQQAAQFRDHLNVVLRWLAGHLAVVFAEQGQIDFAEIGLRALQAIGGEGDVTDTLLRMDWRIEHMLVDELQDTSRGQIMLLERLTSGWVPDDGRTLFLVGDAQQSIYQFRQAEVGLFMRLRERGYLGNVVLDPVTLESNFRSAPEVVEWVNDAFARVLPAQPDPYHGGAPAVAARAQRADLAGAVSVHPVIDDREREAQRVCEVLDDVRARQPEASVALLVRSRSQLRSILPALRRAEIPYTATDIDVIEARSAVQDVVALIRALRHPGDRAAWMRLLRARPVGVTWPDMVTIARLAPGDETVVDGIERALDQGALSGDGRQRLLRLATVVDELQRDSALTFSLPASVRAVWRALDGPRTLQPSEHEDVERVLRLLDEHCRDGVLEDMRAFEAAMARLYASPDQTGVEIMTIHKAKGLEFDVVVVAGLGEPGRGDDPPLLHYQALPRGFLVAPRPRGSVDDDSPEAALYRTARRIHKEREVHEQRRLLYVACTRAGCELHLVGCAHKARKGAVTPANASLLQLLWPAVGDAYSQLDADDNGGQQAVARPTGSAVMYQRWAPPACTRLADAEGLADVPAPVFQPSRTRRLRPSETVIGERGRSRGLIDGSNAARLAGVVYHAVMSRLCDAGGLALWRTLEHGQWHQHCEAQLRELGIRERQLGWASSAVVALLEQTLASRVGQWIVEPEKPADSELELAGLVSGEWVSAAIDRVIYTESSIWLLDYKAHIDWLQRHPVESDIEAATRLHAPQLHDYVTLVRRWLGDDGRSIRPCVFYPAIARLEELAGEQADEVGAKRVSA